MFKLPEIEPELPVLIAGATGSGKSDLALELAVAQGRAVVNADALQVYGCWRKLSARPEIADENRARHLLYGHVDRDAAYSVGTWLGEVRHILATPSSAAPVIVGGTGLYFSCLTEGLAEIPAIAPEVRERSDRILARGGLADLCGDLERDDPDTFASIDLANPKRVQRAWEVYQSTGRGLLDWQRFAPPPILPLKNAAAFVLDGPVDWLRNRLEARFQSIVENGALDEVAANLDLLDSNKPAAQAIGGRELAAYLRGETTLEAAIEAANISTRQYAKRQRSWFRNRMKDWTFLQISQPTWG